MHQNGLKISRNFASSKIYSKDVRSGNVSLIIGCKKINEKIIENLSKTRELNQL